ncbi:TetR/AcrR family transcriptional regulator [Roseobacter sp.]|uniref:TetR/AcrR family transcriptional regulator n=1 Tax=Roseobacter sp. TaxID=1907202 RepID=UPI00385ED30A
MSKSPVAPKANTVRSRDPVRTRAEILTVAVQEFAEHGFYGARVERITKAAKCNARMIYHYFGGKEQLYLAALDSVYAAIRNRETQLRFGTADPATEARRLVEFTFDYFAENENFLKLIRNENLLNGRYIKRSQMIRDMSQPFIAAIGELIERGHKTKVFSCSPDPVQLYVTVVALSAHHLNNAATLGTVVGQDLNDPAWQEERRRHAVEVTLAYLGVCDGLEI